MYQFLLFLLYVLAQSQVIFRRITRLYFIDNSLQSKQSCWLCFRVFNVKKRCSVSDSIAPQNLLLVLLHLLRGHRAIHHAVLYAHLLLHAEDIKKQRQTSKTSRIPGQNANPHTRLECVVDSRCQNMNFTPQTPPPRHSNPPHLCPGDCGDIFFQWKLPHSEQKLLQLVRQDYTGYFGHRLWQP